MDRGSVRIMNILFLDMDGVLVTERSHHGLGGHEGQMVRCDPCAMGLLNRIVNDFDMRVVLSSTWRKTLSLDAMNTILRAQGAQFEILDYTPAKLSHRFRGGEIDEWIEDWNEDNDDKVDINDCLILDDETEFYDHQSHRHVKCSEYDGFGFAEYLECRYLMGEEEHSYHLKHRARRQPGMNDSDKIKARMQWLMHMGLISDFNITSTDEYEMNVDVVRTDKTVIRAPKDFFLNGGLHVVE